MKKTILTKPYIVYTNPPCNDRLSYHIFNQKYTSHVDTCTKVCYDCDSKKVVIIINKKYYCPTCGLHKTGGGYARKSNKRICKKIT